MQMTAYISCKYYTRSSKWPLNWTETQSRSKFDLKSLSRFRGRIGTRSTHRCKIGTNCQEGGGRVPLAEVRRVESELEGALRCSYLALILPRHRHPPSTRSLRVVAAGMRFLTKTHSPPGANQTTRAHEYACSRRGSAPAILFVSNTRGKWRHFPG